jgi:hypothetical protein
MLVNFDDNAAAAPPVGGQGPWARQEEHCRIVPPAIFLQLLVALIVVQRQGGYEPARPLGGCRRQQKKARGSGIVFWQNKYWEV